MHAGMEELISTSANKRSFDEEISKENADANMVNYNKWANLLRTSSDYRCPEDECHSFDFNDERLLWEREFCLIKNQQHSDYFFVEEASPEINLFLKLW